MLRLLRRRSLAKLRHEIEPVDQPVLGRLTTAWQGIIKRRRGADGLLDVIEQLQGAPLPASILESEILPARIDGYDPADLDAVAAAGEVVWVGVESLGERDGRVALYLADHLPRLLPPRENAQPDRQLSDRESRSRVSQTNGAVLDRCTRRRAAAAPAETVDALWNPSGRDRSLTTRFTASAFTRTRIAAASSAAAVSRSARGGRCRRGGADGGRCSRFADPKVRTSLMVVQPRLPAARLSGLPLSRNSCSPTAGKMQRHRCPSGLLAAYPQLRAMEESGRLRRGYFVAGLGATQFALPGAVDLLRSLRDEPDDPEVAILAATDPANPYGATLKWPSRRSPDSTPRIPVWANSASSAGDNDGAARGPTRTVGATVILVNGALAAYLARGDRQLLVFLPDAEPVRSKAGLRIARVLIERARGGDETPRGMLIEEIDGAPPAAHPLAPYLVAGGFIAGTLGFQPNFRV